MDILQNIPPEFSIIFSSIIVSIAGLCIIASAWFTRKAIRNMAKANQDLIEASQHLASAGQNIENAFVSMIDVLGAIKELKKLEHLPKETDSVN